MQNLTIQINISFKPSTYFALVLCSLLIMSNLPVFPPVPCPIVGQKTVGDSQQNPAAKSRIHGAFGIMTSLGQRADVGFSPSESTGIKRKNQQR